MKPSAIVYTSNTGFTRQYAELLHDSTGLPVFSLQDAVALPRGSSVVYLGWLMAGKIQGYGKAKKRYAVAAVCGVGMRASGSQLAELRKANALPDALPVFTLQGGFELTRLRGTYRLLMNGMSKVLRKGLEDKTNRTPDEDAMLEMLLHGGNYVRKENLAPVLDWYAAQA